MTTPPQVNLPSGCDKRQREFQAHKSRLLIFIPAGRSARHEALRPGSGGITGPVMMFPVRNQLPSSPAPMSQSKHGQFKHAVGRDAFY